MGRGTQPTCEHCQLQAAQRTHRRTHRAMRFFSWHTHVGNLRGSVVFFGAATTTYVRGSLLSPGPQQWSTFRKPACRTGGDAGAAPAGSTIGLYAQATTREPRRSGLRRLRKQQGEGLAAPSASDLPKCPQAGPPLVPPILVRGNGRFSTTLFMTRVELRRWTPGRVARRLS
jgi:hypothetical protein